ncbi:MAG: DUF2812 domain-containing protein [Eubacterium sp.]|nr:DUF2812 domain-containing protein [Eubacterium sp.]
MEKETIVKHRIFIIDIEKEQQFMDSYREKGYKLAYLNNESFSFIFKKSKDTFIPRVRIDYRMFSKNDEYQDYLSLFEDAGWKHIKGTKNSGIQYFEQMNDDTNDELFSDKHSHAELYKRLFIYAITWLAIFLCLFFVCLPHYDLTSFLHPKDLFLTPGLWNLNGPRFVFAFLFELPFVLLRNGVPFLWLILIITFAICAINAKRKELSYKNF